MASPRIPPDGNRVLDAIYLRVEPEAKLTIDNRVSRLQDPDALELRKVHYESVLASYGGRNKKKKGLNRAERKSLGFVRHEIRKLDAKLNPTDWKAVRYNPIVNWVANFLIGRQGNYDAHDRDLTRAIKDTSTNYNVAKLGEELEKLGFKKELIGNLRHHMAHDLQKFSLGYSDPALPNTHFNLHFVKMEGTEAYYLEKFVAMGQATSANISKTDARIPKQTYSTLDPIVFNAKEASNIANGRPVRKDVDGEYQWFNSSNISTMQQGGTIFNLERKLAKLHLPEMESPVHRLNLLNSLYAGNLREVTIPLDGEQTRKIQIGVKSDLSGFNFYNEENRKINPDSLMQMSPNLKQLQEHAENLKYAPSVSLSGGLKM